MHFFTILFIILYKESDIIKARVSKDVCIGCGACQALVPSVFEITDEGIAEVKMDIIEDSLKDEVKEAAETCPTGAIEVEE